MSRMLKTAALAISSINGEVKAQTPGAPKNANGKQDAFALKKFGSRQHSRGTSVRTHGVRHTTPALPHIMAIKVQGILSKPVQARKLYPKGATAVEELLDRRQPAGPSKIFPLRLAFLVSEATCNKPARHPRLRRIHP